jgi:acetolactate synthase I/II/III large subunit
VTAPYPEPAALTVLLNTLLTASRPLIFAGGGLYNSPQAFELLVRFAELTQVPVITSWRHHDEFPNDHPLFLGCASLGTPATVWERLADCDVMLVIGNRMQETSTSGYTYPLASTRVLQVDVDPAAFVNHRSPELAIVADAGAALAALIERVPEPVPFRDERLGPNRADRRRFEEATVIPEPVPAGDGVPYAQVMRTLAGTLSPDTIVTSDAGNFYGWLARYYTFRQPRTYVGPASGGMGFGLPSAIGAKIARPGTPVVSLSGDGGFLMTAAELETAARYGVGVVAIVLDNARQGTIRMHQEAQFPGRVIATELGVTDLASLARGLGVDGYLVADGADFEPALRAALNSGGPSVIQVRMDRAQLSVQKRLPSALEVAT